VGTGSSKGCLEEEEEEENSRKKEALIKRKRNVDENFIRPKYFIHNSRTHS
jgi:hypothetical protein